MSDERRLGVIRWLLGGFMAGLVVSGVTAFPLPAEVSMLASWLGAGPADGEEQFVGLTAWIVRVRDALDATERSYPFLFYGYDWLAFGHLVIALAFLGPFSDPVRNIWVIRWGMLSCLLVIPLALVCWAVRGIPLGWQLVDCAFGVVGIVPLWVAERMTAQMTASTQETSSS